MKVKLHIFFTSELVGDEFSASRSGSFNPGERAPGTICKVLGAVD
jgi:hypothetical protein